MKTITMLGSMSIITYRIIKAGLHPPFWYFADIYNSHLYLTEAPEAIDKSSIANDTEQWEKNVYGGREIYKEKRWALSKPTTICYI